MRVLFQQFYEPFAQGALVDARISRDVSPPPPYLAEYDGCVVVDFCFVDGSAQSIAGLEQSRFIADFENALKSLRAWSLEQAWVQALLPNLQVVVSPEFRISRALVPAWNGRSGTIEFPARRVIAGQAAIVHELTHVFFPSGNRLLAEGLAIYLQALLGPNPTFPNFFQPLHQAALDRLYDTMPAARSSASSVLDEFQLASLDAIPTPNPLTLEIGGRFCGEDKDGQATLYCLAGSFVEFLINGYGLERFHRLYNLTPLRIGELDAGSTRRWLEAYDLSLSDLETRWKAFLTDMSSSFRISGKANVI